MGQKLQEIDIHTAIVLCQAPIQPWPDALCKLTTFTFFTIYLRAQFNILHLPSANHIRSSHLFSTLIRPFTVVGPSVWNAILKKSWLAFRLYSYTGF